MKKYPNNKSSEEELVSKLLRLSGGENTFEFNLGQLIGGDGPQVGDIVSQNGIRYEVLEDGSYRQIN